MEQQENYDEISLKELIMTVINHKREIMILAVLFAVIAMGVSYYMNDNSKEAKLLFSVNHSKMSEGKNIDGSKFDSYDIASPFILGDVITSLGLEGTISPNDIRKNVSVTPIIPASAVAESEFALEKQGTNVAYYPNEFMLTVKSDAASGITAEMAQKIANQMVDSYITYFQKTYIAAKPVVNKILTFTPDDYDYSDVSNVYHSQLETIIDYNATLNVVDPNYRSKTTGMSFNDIIQAAGIIDEIDLNRIDSLISAYKLTKDSDKLIIYYEYLIEQLEFELSKGQNSADLSTEMLNQIDNTSNVLIDSMVDGMSNEEGYFTTLVLQSASLASSAAIVEEDIAYYKRELEELKSGNYIVGQGPAVDEVQKLIASTHEQLTNWINISNQTSEEFYKKLMTRAVTPLSPAEVYSSVNMKMNVAIGIVLGLMIGVFYAFFREYWKSA